MKRGSLRKYFSFCLLSLRLMMFTFIWNLYAGLYIIVGTLYVYKSNSQIDPYMVSIITSSLHI